MVDTGDTQKTTDNARGMAKAPTVELKTFVDIKLKCSFTACYSVTVCNLAMLHSVITSYLV